MKIPEDIWIILIQATHSMENNDNTMSGKPSMEAERAREWLMVQETE